MDSEAARLLVAEGEGQRTEFKESLRREKEAIKSLCAFAHADGGSVFFGVTDTGKIIGAHLGQNTLENLANSIRANTQPPLIPLIYPLKIDGQVIVVVEVQKAKPEQLFYAFNRPYVRVGKTNQVMAPEHQRARLSWAVESNAGLSTYIETLSAIARGFRDQKVIGRLSYVRTELARGDKGYRTFLKKINYQRVQKPELMSANAMKLTPHQSKMLSQYRDQEWELEDFINHVVANKAEFEGKPKNALTGYEHRLQKLSEALDRLIEMLEK